MGWAWALACGFAGLGFRLLWSVSLSLGSLKTGWALNLMDYGIRQPEKLNQDTRFRLP